MRHLRTFALAWLLLAALFVSPIGPPGTQDFWLGGGEPRSSEEGLGVALIDATLSTPVEGGSSGSSSATSTTGTTAALAPPEATEVPSTLERPDPTTTISDPPPAPPGPSVAEGIAGGGQFGGGPSGRLQTYTGPAVIDFDTSISDVVVYGRLEIRAAVTLRNVRLVCATAWACIRVLPSGSLDISEFSIVGPGQAGVQNLGGIIGENVVARRGEITGVENGVVMDRNVLLEDVYVHDLAHVGSAHPDGIQHDGGGSDLTLRRVRVEVAPTDTSAVMINNENGAVSDLLIESSIISGGGFSLYLEGAKSSAPIHATVVGNRFGRHGYGPALVRGPVTVNQSGNTLADGQPHWI